MRARCGFSLVEAVVAFLVLFVAIGLSFYVISQVRRGGQLSEMHVAAAYAAHSLLNQERSIDFAQVVAASGTLTSSGTRNGQAYTQSLLYNVDVELLDTNTKRVKATVRWTDSGGSKQVILQTVVTDI